MGFTSKSYTHDTASSLYLVKELYRISLQSFVLNYFPKGTHKNILTPFQTLDSSFSNKTKIHKFKFTFSMELEPSAFYGKLLWYWSMLCIDIYT